MVSNRGSVALLLVRLGTMFLYLIFMAVKRFATRFSNFKFFLALMIFGWIVRLVSENVVNFVIDNQDLTNS